MKHIVCLTKSYELMDFDLWFKYHYTMGYFIHIIDNESSVDILSNILKYNQNNCKPNFTYEQLKGFPDQWNLFSKILNENSYNFQDGDFVAFIDDDEYLWYYLDYYKQIENGLEKYKGKIYEPMESYLDKQLNEFNVECILVPQVLMSTREILQDRFTNLINGNQWSRDDKSSQGKCIIKYHKGNVYDFAKDNIEKGHIPYINGVRKSVVNGIGISTTTYGEVDRSACLRLYHYHLKSINDWNKKWNRGSAALPRQWYNKDIKQNMYYDGYTRLDTTMADIKEAYNL